VVGGSAGGGDGDFGGEIVCGMEYGMMGWEYVRICGGGGIWL